MLEGSGPQEAATSTRTALRALIPVTSTRAQAPRRAVVEIGAYPSATGSPTLGGTVVFESDGAKLQVFGYVTGLQAYQSGAWRVYKAFNSYEAACSYQYAARIVDYYTRDDGSNPWTATFNADADGVAELSLIVSGYSIDEIMPVAGRTFVVESVGASRIGCGAIVPSKAEVARISKMKSWVRLASQERARPRSHLDRLVQFVQAKRQ